MRIKKTPLLILMILCFSLANAQKVKFKKGEDVYVDGKKTFTFERRSMSTEFSLYKPNSKDEILYIHSNSNGTTGYNKGGDDYYEITFVQKNQKVQSSKFNGRNYKWLIKRLLEEEVLNTDGSINLDKMEQFITKYNENMVNVNIRN